MYKNAASGSTITSTYTRTAALTDENPYGTPTNSNITVYGSSTTLNAAGRLGTAGAGLGFILSGTSITYRSISFTNFAKPATGDGGVILSSSASRAIFAGAINFSGNTARLGGAIYNAANSTITFVNGAMAFSGNVATSSGGAIYNLGTITLDQSGGNITFSGNRAGNNNIGNDIYNTGTINITGTANDVVISSGIAGSNTGVINKQNNGRLLLGGNNASYTGRYVHSGGTTVVTGEYFTGTSSVTAGLLELSTGAVLGGGTIGIYNTGRMDIITPANLTFSGQVSGNGTINKYSTSTLTLSGSNSGFTGTYNQTAGTTSVSGNYFNGQSNITGGILVFATGTGVSETNTKVMVGASGTLSITATGSLSFGANFLSGTGLVSKTAGQLT